MTCLYQKKLKLYNSNVLLHKDNNIGLSEEFFEVVTGSRLVFSLYVSAIDVGATVSVNVKNSFSKDVPHILVKSMALTAVGHTSVILGDFHNLFKTEVNVTGGNASYFLGVSVADNALATGNISVDAEVHVDLNHETQTNGKYDSVRIGDGENELKLVPDGSMQVIDFANTASISAAIEIDKDPIVANVAGTENYEDRKFIIIQPLDGTAYIGSSATSQPFRLARRSYTVIKIGAAIDVYIMKTGNSKHNVAIWEFK